MGVFIMNYRLHTVFVSLGLLLGANLATGAEKPEGHDFSALSVAFASSMTVKSNKLQRRRGGSVSSHQDVSERGIASTSSFATMLPFTPGAGSGSFARTISMSDMSGSAMGLRRSCSGSFNPAGAGRGSSPSPHNSDDEGSSSGGSGSTSPHHSAPPSPIMRPSNPSPIESSSLGLWASSPQHSPNVSPQRSPRKLGASSRTQQSSFTSSAAQAASERLQGMAVSDADKKISAEATQAIRNAVAACRDVQKELSYTSGEYFVNCIENQIDLVNHGMGIKDRVMRDKLTRQPSIDTSLIDVDFTRRHFQLFKLLKSSLALESSVNLQIKLATYQSLVTVALKKMPAQAARGDVAAGEPSRDLAVNAASYVSSDSEQDMHGPVFIHPYNNNLASGEDYADSNIVVMHIAK